MKVLHSTKVSSYDFRYCKCFNPFFYTFAQVLSFFFTRPSFFTTIPRVAPALFHSSLHPPFSAARTLFSSATSFTRNKQHRFQIHYKSRYPQDRCAARPSFAQLVNDFPRVSRDAKLAGTTTISDIRKLGETSLSLRLHNHDVACSEESNRVVIGAPKSQKQGESLSKLYRFHTSDEVPEAMGYFYTIGFYAQDSCAMRATSASAGLKTTSSNGPHCFVGPTSRAVPIS